MRNYKSLHVFKCTIVITSVYSSYYCVDLHPVMNILIFELAKVFLMTDAQNLNGKP